MWLQPKGVPDSRDGRLRQVHLTRHEPRAPVGGPFGDRLQRARDHRIDTRIIDATRGTRAGCIEQAIQAQLDEARPPLGPRLGCDALAGGNRLALHLVSGSASVIGQPASLAHQPAA